GLIRKCKKLYREHTSYTQLGGNLFTQCLSALLQLRVNSRGWRDSFSAHTVALHRLSQRPSGNLARGSPRDQHGKLADQRNLLFSHQGHAAARKVRDQSSQLRFIIRKPYAFAVVATPARLQADLPGRQGPKKIGRASCRERVWRKAEA